MKKLALVVAVAGLLSACGSTGYKADNYSERASQALAQQTRSQQTAIDQAPQ